MYQMRTIYVSSHKLSILSTHNKSTQKHDEKVKYCIKITINNAQESIHKSNQIQYITRTMDQSSINSILLFSILMRGLSWNEERTLLFIHE